MAAQKLFVEVQDEQGNIYYIHTSSEVVFCSDGETVEEKLKNATAQKDGRMSAVDKKKLDGIAEGANKYVHPTGSGNGHIPSGGTTGQVLRNNGDGIAEWGSDKDTTYAAFKAATSSTAGGAGLVPAPAAGNNDDYLRGDGKWVAAGDMVQAFSKAGTRANIASGEANKTLFGKIMKWFADLKSHVFLDLVQNATTKDTTRAVSAAVAAELQKQIDSLSSSLTTIERHEMAGSTYLPPSYIYKNCKIVQFRCVGYAKKELNTGTAYQVGTLPEKYRPVADLYKYEQFVKGKECQVIILTTGEITVQFFENVSVDGAMNINVYFIAK